MTVTFDDEIILIGVTTTENDIGDVIEQEVRTPVLCSVLSVSRSEFYQAAAHDMKPSIVFLVNKYEYNGQKYVEYEEKKYEVIREYEPRVRKAFKGSNNMDLGNFETIELVCEAVKQNGNA